MKRGIFLFIAFLFTILSLSRAQEIKGTLSAVSDTAVVSVIDIFPDSFPGVSVVFRASTKTGNPLWQLKKEDLSVQEDKVSCEIISLEQISINQPLHIGIVIDHSSSMSDDYSLLLDSVTGLPLYKFDADGNSILPPGYVPPIDRAKTAVITFVSTFNSTKDSISIIGFSSTVDTILPLTNDVSRIRAVVDSMKADYWTALYDAMMAGLEEVGKAPDPKFLVVLTDGMDNVSQAKWRDVISLAKKNEIPVYIIGLGDCNPDTLRLIADSTNGMFYYTRSSNALDTIYDLIGRQIRAYYNLVYHSPNLAFADSTREVQISFRSIPVAENSSAWNLPPEVTAWLEKKEREKQYTIYGSMALATVVAGVLLFRFTRRKRTQPTIHKVYPNPTSGLLNVESSVSGGMLKIIDLSGNKIRSIPIEDGQTQVDLSDLRDGTYMVVSQSNGVQSNAVKFVIQH